MPKQNIEQLSINTIRTLTVDAVQAAQSGHPGAPLGLAPAAYLLYTRIMKHNPADPKWPDRDRFVLSAGHASMLLYACLYLSGYDLSLDDIKQFRQLGSRTPGHPENFETPGVETTTGPLGQGFGNAVGMAMAEKFLRERYGAEACDHHIFAICSDGDLMEGVASEAASLAGHLKLGRCVFLYDDNKVTIDGRTALSFSQEDVPKRFDAYGWHTLTVEDGNDLEAIEAAIRAGIAEEERPTLISLKTVIGYGSPRAGTRNAHSDPMPEEQVRATKEALGWDPDAQFLVPEEVLAHFDQRERGAAAQKEWEAHLERWATRNVEAAAEWRDAQTGRPSAGAVAALPVFDADPKGISTRVAGKDVMQAFAPYVPTMIGGAADLVHSTFTEFKDDAWFTPGARRAQRRVGRSRARDGRRGQRPRAARRNRQAVLLDVLRLHRLHAPADPALGADEPRLRLDLQPRLGRSRRGRADAPAGRAPRRDARDPEPDRDPPGRRERDGRGVGRDPRGSERPGLPRPLPPERADDRPRRARSRFRPPPRRVRSRRGRLARRGARRDRRRGRNRARRKRPPHGAGCDGACRLDAELGALRGPDHRIPRGRAAARRAEDLGRSRRDVRLVTLGRRLDRHRLRFGASGKGDKVLEHFGISPGSVAERVQAMVAELARS